MRKIDIIRERIEKSLGADVQLKILDESAHHAGHMGAQPGGETHFRIEVTSPKFENISLVKRHRLIYAALGGAFDEGLHALEIHAKAPGE